jgi:hypothetical protein
MGPHCCCSAYPPFEEKLSCDRSSAYSCVTSGIVVECMGGGGEVAPTAPAAGRHSLVQRLSESRVCGLAGVARQAEQTQRERIGRRRQTFALHAGALTCLLCG